MTKKEHPSTKLCKHCKTEIPYDAKVCPNCRKKQGMALWLKVLIVFAVLAIIGGVFGGDSEDKNPEIQPTTPEVEKVDGGETTPTPEEPETVTYKIGDTVKVGNVEYVVNSISSSKTYGNQYLFAEANDMFLIVNVSVKNCGNESLDVFSDFFKLKNGEKTYECDSGNSIYVPEEAILYETINPDSTLTGNILFDIAQEAIDAPELQLQVQTGVWGTETGLINLH